MNSKTIASMVGLAIIIGVAAVVINQTGLKDKLRFFRGGN